VARVQSYGPGNTALTPLARALSRPRARPRGGAVLGSIALHATLVAAFWISGRQLAERMPEFRVYRVNIVSPPPQVQGDPTPAVQAPEPVPEVPPPAAEPPPPPPRIETPRPPPQQAPPQQQQPPPAETRSQTQTPPREPPRETPPPRESTPARGNNPQPVEVAGDGINVQMEGAEFPFPGYLENVISQIHRHFRWSGAPNLEAQVHFYILTDGSVGGIRVIRPSGNVRFDLEATSAVEQAGRRGAFGPLPDGWQQDRLWVSFRFLPPR
jgi:periplasmic protein TonB